MRPATVVKKDLLDLTARRFRFRSRGQQYEGFVVRKGDRYFAYQNECRHVPVALDLNGGDFFTFARDKLQCHGHGAVYEIETGLCVGGPCQGARLFALEVVEEEKRLLILVPEALDDKSGEK